MVEPLSNYGSFAKILGIPDIDVSGDNVSPLFCIETSGYQRQTVGGNTMENLEGVTSGSNADVLQSRMLHSSQDV